jgi:hypothetical protein
MLIRSNHSSNLLSRESISNHDFLHHKGDFGFAISTGRAQAKTGTSAAFPRRTQAANINRAPAAPKLPALLTSPARTAAIGRGSSLQTF